MLFASSLFPLLLQTNDPYCAIREMKYNYFFEASALSVLNDKKIAIIILNCTQFLSW